MLVSVRRPWRWGFAVALVAGLVAGCNNTEVIPLEKERPIVVISPPGSQAASKAKANTKNDGVSGGSSEGEYRP